MTPAGDARHDLPTEIVERAMDRAAGSRPIPGNRVELLYDGPAVYPAMLDRIAAATRWIHLDNYIIRSDATGRRFAEALRERALAGVPVRVLTDWVGSMTTRRSFWRRLRDAGVEVRVFNPPHPLALRKNLTRDHRKLLVVDGITAVTGGLCLGDEWAGRPAGGRLPWRDTALAIAGPAASAIDRAFAGLWGLLGVPLDPSELAADVEERGTTSVRVVAGEPGGVRASRATELVLAGVAERVWITDAYLVAPPAIYQALVDAARGGVDVRLLVPGASDLPSVRNMTRLGYRDLLAAGVRIFEWRGPMLHAKTLVADGRWVRVGSSNLNLSSLLANYEIDILAEDPDLAQELERQFRRDGDGSVEIRAVPRRRPGRIGYAEVIPPPELPRLPHHPGLRERRRRVVVALQGLLVGARRMLLLPLSVVLTGLAVLFLLFPRVMATGFAVLSLWLAMAAWLDQPPGPSR